MEDGIKCGSNRMCYEQRCVTVSSLGLPQCPTGSNGTVCSGNGVRMGIELGTHAHIIYESKTDKLRFKQGYLELAEELIHILCNSQSCRYVTTKASAHVISATQVLHVKIVQVCATYIMQ